MVIRRSIVSLKSSSLSFSSRAAWLQNVKGVSLQSLRSLMYGEKKAHIYTLLYTTSRQQGVQITIKFKITNFQNFPTFFAFLFTLCTDIQSQLLVEVTTVSEALFGSLPNFYFVFLTIQSKVTYDFILFVKKTP